MIELFLQKQSDLGLHCLSGPFWQATSVQNFRTYIGKDLLGSLDGPFHGEDCNHISSSLSKNFSY